MEVLMDAEEYKRVGTVLVVDEKNGVRQVVSKQKKMTTTAERKILAEERKQFKIANDIQPAGTYRQVFATKKKNHALAVAESRALYEMEIESV